MSVTHGRFGSEIIGMPVLFGCSVALGSTPTVQVFSVWPTAFDA